MRSRLFIPCWALIAALACTAVEAQDTAGFSGTPEELKLIRLIDEMYEHYQKLYENVEKITDVEQQSDFYTKHDPATEYVPRLLDFESRHRGSRVALMALRQIIVLSGGGGAYDSPIDIGRRTALERLARYGKYAELAEIVRYLDSGNFEPATESFLRSVVTEAESLPLCRQYAQLMLARWMLHARDTREFCVGRLKELQEGAELRYPGEAKELSEHLQRLPKPDRLAAWEREAFELLSQIAQSGSDHRQPAVMAVDPQRYIIRVDQARTKTMPKLTEVAAGELFKESHLRPSKPAPGLELTLIGGEKWSLADQIGKAVIVQFSFKGCGPCEAMYPDLQDLQTKYQEEITILSVMADERREDTEKTATEGKVTWNIHWDGFRGPVATRWAVTAFPTVYVIDATGQVAAVNVRGEQLKQKVRDILGTRE